MRFEIVQKVIRLKKKHNSSQSFFLKGKIISMADQPISSGTKNRARKSFGNPIIACFKSNDSEKVEESHGKVEIPSKEAHEKVAKYVQQHGSTAKQNANQSNEGGSERHNE